MSSETYPKLTFVTHEYPPTCGGAATVVAGMAAAAHGLGRSPRVLAPGGPCSADSGSPVPVVRMGHRGRQDFLACRALRRFLERNRPATDEHLVLCDPGATRAALGMIPFLRGLSAGFSVILHGSEVPLFAGGSARGRFRVLLENARRVHLLSRANSDLLANLFPDLSADLRVAPGAPSEWALTLPPRSERAGDGDRPVSILTVGRIHPRKGQLETLRALAALPPEYGSKIVYHLVGPCVRARYLARIRRAAAECPFPVRISGALSEAELAEAYARADIFALCSRPLRRSIEGFGLVYLDAAAAGLPVVANRTGGVAEAVCDGRTGILADPGDPASLTAAFQALLSDREKCVAFGEEGRRWARSFQWEDTVGRVWG